MKSSIRLNLLVLKSLTSFWILLFLGSLVWLFALMASVEGAGPSALVTIGNLTIPFRILSTTFGIVEVLIGVMIVIVSISLSDNVLSSQLSCIYLARHQNRYEYFAAFISVVFLFIVLSTSGYLLLYIKAGFGYNEIFFMYASHFLEGFSLAIVLVSITYFSRLKLVSIPLLVLIVFIIPLLLRAISGNLGNYYLLGDLTYYLEQAFSFHVNLTTFRDNILSRGFIQYELFTVSAIVIAALIGLNVAIFKRKDFKNAH